MKTPFFKKKYYFGPKNRWQLQRLLKARLSKDRPRSRLLRRLRPLVSALPQKGSPPIPRLFPMGAMVRWRPRNPPVKASDHLIPRPGNGLAPVCRRPPLVPPSGTPPDAAPPLRPSRHRVPPRSDVSPAGRAQSGGKSEEKNGRRRPASGGRLEGGIGAKRWTAVLADFPEGIARLSRGRPCGVRRISFSHVVAFSPFFIV